MNYNIHLKDWINFEAEIDRMFGLHWWLSWIEAVKLWEMLSEIQVSEIHCCTCFFALDYTSPNSQGILLQEDTTLIQELTEEETQPHPKEDCPYSGSVYTDSWQDLKTISSSPLSLVVVRKTSKPSTALKQDSENKGAFA